MYEYTYFLGQSNVDVSTVIQSMSNVCNIRVQLLLFKLPHTQLRAYEYIQRLFCDYSSTSTPLLSFFNNLHIVHTYVHQHFFFFCFPTIYISYVHQYTTRPRNSSACGNTWGRWAPPRRKTVWRRSTCSCSRSPWEAATSVPAGPATSWGA